MNYLKKIVIVFCLILWPINLYLNNTFPDFVTYLIPLVLLIFSFALYKYRKDTEYYLLPVLLIGFFQPKLVLLPVLFCLTQIFIKHTKITMISLIISVLIFCFFFRQFRGQTVFTKDYQAEQLVLRNTELYPNVFMARLFQNKPRIYIDKLADNFFALTDLNNYFFGLHPRPITINNQNLFEYPFVAIVFFLYGIHYIGKSNDKKFIFISFFSALISLMVLQNFDRNDFILWLPISLIIIHGIESMSKQNKKLFSIISTLLIVFAIPEILRSFVQKRL